MASQLLTPVLVAQKGKEEKKREKSPPSVYHCRLVLWDAFVHPPHYGYSFPFSSLSCFLDDVMTTFSSVFIFVLADEEEKTDRNMDTWTWSRRTASSSSLALSALSALY